MTIFVDASALVAIVAGEDDADDIARRLAADPDRLWSAMSCWESVLAIKRSRFRDFEPARADVQATAELLGLTLVAIGEPERSAALDAYERYGKGRHAAELNMGDCFAYACARTNDAALLYKGGDFAHTDLA